MTDVCHVFEIILSIIYCILCENVDIIYGIYRQFWVMVLSRYLCPVSRWPSTTRIRLSFCIATRDRFASCPIFHSGASYDPFMASAVGWQPTVKGLIAEPGQTSRGHTDAASFALDVVKSRLE